MLVYRDGCAELNSQLACFLELAPWNEDLALKMWNVIHSNSVDAKDFVFFACMALFSESYEAYLYGNEDPNKPMRERVPRVADTRGLDAFLEINKRAFVALLGDALNQYPVCGFTHPVLQSSQRIKRFVRNAKIGKSAFDLLPGDSITEDAEHIEEFVAEIQNAYLTTVYPPDETGRVSGRRLYVEQPIASPLEPLYIPDPEKNAHKK